MQGGIEQPRNGRLVGCRLASITEERQNMALRGELAGRARGRREDGIKRVAVDLSGRTPALLLTTSRASAATNRPDGSANSQVVTPSERAPLLPLAIRKDDGSCAVCANTPGSCAVPGAEARSDNARWSVTRESWVPSGSGHGVP
jgi:hypothetical protein